MTTTVPQNIKGCNFNTTQHLPTRNSLRHSRMIVGKKNYQGKKILLFIDFEQFLIRAIDSKKLNLKNGFSN